MNFGLRLDEILCDTLNGEGVYREYSGKVKAAGQDEAKQAITSLIKELVAGAIPEDNCMDCTGVMQFEQNLLKSLEEK